MLTLDALRAVRTIVSHDNCADGLASALLACDALPDAKPIFMQYGTAAHRALEPTPGMLFCDFSPHPDRVPEFVEAGTIVLDHHRTAKAIVVAMRERGIYADEEASPGVSGAVLVYEHVWKHLRAESPAAPFAERFAALAGVYDTWQRADARWRDAHIQSNLLHFFPRDGWMTKGFTTIAATWDTELLWIGETLLAREDERVRRATDAAYRFTTAKGTRVVVLTDSSIVNMAADALGSSADVVIAFSFSVDAGRQRIKFATRSSGSFDCRAFAQTHGGGGHTHAAGFSQLLTPGDLQPYQLLEGLLAEV